MESKGVLEIDGRKVHFLRFGSGDKKLVMLHGWGGSSGSFVELAPHLAKQNNLEVVVPDLPGFGQSDPPPAEGWNTHDYADWLEKFLVSCAIRTRREPSSRTASRWLCAPDV